MTVKEKARIAWEQEREVEVTWGMGKTKTENVWVKDYDVTEMRIQTYDGSTYAPRWCDITDIRFVDEQGAKPIDRRVIDDSLLREATLDELGAENEALRARVKELGGGSDVDTTECGEAPESLRQKLEHAMLMGCEVRVEGEGYTIGGKIKGIGRYEVGDDRELMDFESGASVYLDSISHVEKIAHAQPESEPDEPHDIAKERWGWRPVGSGEGLVRLDDPEADIDSPEQKKLRAAAPELADKLRSLLQSVYAIYKPDHFQIAGFGNAIELLDRLEVKGSWYEDEEAEPPLPDLSDMKIPMSDAKEMPEIHDTALGVPDNVISAAQTAMRQRFENDSEWRLAYIMNIEMLMYDILGPENHPDRVEKEISKKILERIFGI